MSVQPQSSAGNVAPSPSQAPRQGGMGRGTKTCLGCGFILLAVCCILGVFSAIAIPLAISSLTASLTTSADPVQAKRVASQIADYSLPQGHVEQAGVDLMAMQMAVIAPQRFNETDDLGDGYLIMLMAIRFPVDSAQVEQQMRDTLLDQTRANNVTFYRVGERRATIRGQTVVLSIYEDEPTGGAIRMVTGAFQGKAGQTILIMAGGVATWDWNKVEGFLGSVR